VEIVPNFVALCQRCSLIIKVNEISTEDAEKARVRAPLGPFCALSGDERDAGG
jgi:hypothetical protein